MEGFPRIHSGQACSICPTGWSVWLTPRPRERPKSLALQRTKRARSSFVLRKFLWLRPVAQAVLTTAIFIATRLILITSAFGSRLATLGVLRASNAALSRTGCSPRIPNCPLNPGNLGSVFALTMSRPLMRSIVAVLASLANSPKTAYPRDDGFDGGFGLRSG